MSNPPTPPSQQPIVNYVTNALGLTNNQNTAPVTLTPEQFTAASRFGQAIQQMYINHLQALQTIDTFNKSLQAFLIHSATTNPPEIHALQERVANAYRLRYIDEITQLMTQMNAQVHEHAMHPPPEKVIEVKPEWKPGERVIDQFGRTKVNGEQQALYQLIWAFVVYFVTTSLTIPFEFQFLAYLIGIFVWLFGAAKIYYR